MSSPSTRMAALAIGVSDASPLPFLSGALNGARAFHEWAQALGYESRLVTDETDQVTVARLRHELEPLLPADGSGLHRLLVYFAGHGVIREAGQGIWLLSDWNQELRAVDVEGLRNRLLQFGVAQVAFFADACRTLPPDLDLAELTPDPILGKGPVPRSATMAVDKFIAAQDGTTTFMIPGADPADDRCLFSGVLLQGLWGTKPAAFSKVLPDKVTSKSLGTYLQTEVSEVAQSYKLTLVPSWSSMFPEGDDIYFGDGPKVSPPDFPPWPPPEDLIGLGGTATEADFRAVPAAPPPDSGLADQLRNQERPDAFETRSGFAVDGAAVVGIRSPKAVAAESHGRPDWWRLRPVDGGVLEQPAPVLIELASGLFAAATALPGFIGSLAVTDRGVAALVYREVDAPPDAGSATEDAILRLERGGLQADDVTDLAADLRQGKLADPVRGVIGAYLYDSIGDLESIRRMAFYYAQDGQAIPYDIAFLARLEGERRDDGLLGATIPAVSAREPRTDQERQLRWTYEATPQATGLVAGLWPWLRQGWGFLDDPAEDGSTLVLPGLIEAADDLTPARFTTLHHAGARRLADAFALSDSTQGGQQ
jgi:caspase domain-containing protein